MLFIFNQLSYWELNYHQLQAGGLIND